MNADETSSRMTALAADFRAVCERQEHSCNLSELFGLRAGALNDPLQERFAADMTALTANFAAGEPDSAATRAVLETLFSLAGRHTEVKSAYWMLVAVQGLSLELIPGLSRGDAAALAKAYAADWPRHCRLPVQDAVLKALKKAGK